MSKALTQNTLIEFARRSDTAEISRLSRDEVEYGLGWDYRPQKLLRLIRNKSKNVVVARVGNEFAGFGIMTYHREHANLDLLAVKEARRRRKIGTGIVLWLEKVALTAGAFNVFVQVREQNSGALGFYEYLGYQQIDQIPGFYQGIENGVVMAKSLRPLPGAG